jgi:hypothetical protein
MRAALLASIFAVVIGTGCTSTRVGDLTIASPKNLSYDFEVVGVDVNGRDCTHWITFIPFGQLNPTIDGAIEAALDTVSGANALTDATLTRSILFTLIYNRGCVTASGTPIRAGHD